MSLVGVVMAMMIPLHYPPSRYDPAWHLCSTWPPVLRAYFSRHCEEQSDEAIQLFLSKKLDCFAALAMTKKLPALRHPLQHQPVEAAGESRRILRQFAVEDLRLLEEQEGKIGTVGALA